MNPLEEPKWNFWQVLYLILIIYLVEFFLGWLKPPENLSYQQGYINYLVVGFGHGLIFFIALFLFIKIKKITFADVGLINFGLKSLLAGIAGGIVLFFLIGFFGNFLTDYLGVPQPQSFALVVQGADSIAKLIPLLLLGSIVVPLQEEILFRGLVYPPLRQTYGRGVGILLTALFFGLMHFDFIRFLVLVVGGLLLTLLYEKTRSLWSAIITHGVWNILMTVLMWLQKG